MFMFCSGLNTVKVGFDEKAFVGYEYTEEWLYAVNYSSCFLEETKNFIWKGKEGRIEGDRNDNTIPPDWEVEEW